MLHNVNLWSCFLLGESMLVSKQTDRDSVWRSSNPKVSVFCQWRCHSGEKKKEETVNLFTILTPAVTRSRKLGWNNQFTAKSQSSKWVQNAKLQTQLHVHKTTYVSLSYVGENEERVTSHNVFVRITYFFTLLNSCHPKVISIIMVSSLSNGILPVIMYGRILCRHYQSCHSELHKCNYSNPLITKQCNLLLEWKTIMELYEYHKGCVARKTGTILDSKNNKGFKL